MVIEFYLLLGVCNGFWAVSAAGQIGAHNMMIITVWLIQICNEQISNKETAVTILFLGLGYLTMIQYIALNGSN